VLGVFGRGWGMNNIRRDVVRVERHSGAVGVIGG